MGEEIQGEHYRGKCHHHIGVSSVAHIKLHICKQTFTPLLVDLRMSERIAPDIET
jgi:hypothetical protein